MDTSLNVPLEKPANGLAGLKYWRQDVVAGLLVSLISLPFSLGIAVASGAPPVCGLISAIIAGLILPFLGGSYVTISGPAAGLAPVLLASMTILGRGNLTTGYPLLLGVIFMTGCVQIVLSKLKAAKYSAWFPSTVVEAMLASIGFLIIAKQIPYLLGVKFHAREFWGMVAETPSGIRAMNPTVFVLGIACLALLFLLTSIKARWAKVIPPQLTVVVVGAVVGRILGLDGKYLIHVPENVFAHGVTMPNFAGLWNDQALWFSILTTVVTLTLIDGVESLATASAIDRIDPYRRRSNPNRVLFAMGVSNICSSLAGGLTIIPGGVKSKACIQGGGKTLWANFYNALFLIIFLFVAKDLINLIPYTALAAMLIYTGYKLCEPSIWRHMAHVGREQIVLFALTILVTLTTDLLWGIIFGVVAKLLMNIVFASTAGRSAEGGPAPVLSRVARAVANAPTLFRDPVTRRELCGEEYHLYFGRPLVSFNALHLNEALGSIPREARDVVLHVTDRVPLIDHTSCDNLFHFAEEYEHTAGGHVTFVGLDEMRMRSHHHSCMRLGVPSLSVAPHEPLDGSAPTPALAPAMPVFQAVE
jgi:carbonic anhydrase